MNESILRIQNLDSRQFKQDYLAQNRPVIITGYDTLREASKKWSFDYLVSKHPGHKVPVDYYHDSRYSPPENRNPPLEQLHMDYKEYVSRIQHSPEDRKKLYLAEQPLSEFPSEITQEAAPPAFLEGKKTYPVIFMGIDTYSHAHYHPVRNEAILMQMMGRKKLILISAKDYQCWYPNPQFSWNMNWSSIPMDVDPSKTFNDSAGYQAWIQRENKHGKYLKASSVKTLECVLEAGEILFIPQGWFHLVYGIGENISVTHFFKSSWLYAYWPLAIRDGLAWLLGTKHRT